MLVSLGTRKGSCVLSLFVFTIQGHTRNTFSGTESCTLNEIPFAQVSSRILSNKSTLDLSGPGVARPRNILHVFIPPRNLAAHQSSARINHDRSELVGL